MGKNIKWFVTTILVGLIPSAARAFIYVLLAENKRLTFLEFSDLLVWGFTVNISIFNARDNFLSNDKRINEVAQIFSVCDGRFVFSFICMRTD